MFGIIDAVLLLMGLSLLVYYYLTSTYDFWKSRGVKGPKPLPFYGTYKDVIKSKLSMGSYVDKMYKSFEDEPYVGIYAFRTPALVLRDLDLIRDVLIKDFNKFPDRGSSANGKIEPLLMSLVHLSVDKWKPLRSHLTPTFTSGKLKKMFFLLVECAEQLENYLREKIERATGNDEAVMECRELAAKYTTDVVGACIFGLKLNAISDDNNPFRVIGRRVIKSWRKLTLCHMRLIVPRIYRLIGSLLAERDLDNFFIDLTRDTMAHRKENGIVRHDFIDLLMDIRDNPNKMAAIEFTDSLLAAQLYVFFVAGFETSSATISNALYELAINQKVQDRLRNEIKAEMNRTCGILDYEGINSMKYLDMVLKETLRKYPVFSCLIRLSVEDYTFESSTKEKLLTIKKGENRLWIPVYAIHHDPKYYPEPEVFDPERFTEEAVKTRHPMAYMPFGQGPRNCIGKRFGEVQMKVAILKILHHYRVEVCEKTVVPYEIDQKAQTLAPKHGIHLKFIRENDASHDNL